MATETGNTGAVDDPRTLGRTRLSFANEAEIDDFVATLEKFERGEITPDEWRGYRLVRGTYGQRQTTDAQMMRVKIPQGVLGAAQLEALAEVGEKFSRGFGHITTRQNIQFHFMKLHDVEPAMRRLADAGLTTREACGNSVRNITCCPYAGVSAGEAFDVTPYSEELTRFFLRHKLSSSLPRKFKIAFEGCPEDHAYTAIHDIGWRAMIKDGRRGFQVNVGGGTATMTATARLLYEFLPAGEMLDVAEAVVRVFHAHGDRVHRHRNRMKFLLKTLGWDGWRAAYEKALAESRAEGHRALSFDPDAAPEERAPDWSRAAPPSAEQAAARVTLAEPRGPGIVPEVSPMFPVMNGDLTHWARTNVRPQKQPGYAIVTATVVLGDLTSEQLRVLRDLAVSYGDGSVRVSVDQDLMIRWVKKADVPELYRRLAAAGLGLPDANTVADVTSCPGAESCKLAVTQSRGLGRTLGDHLRARPELVKAAEDLKIKISGCPNGCGQHHIAGIGFQGSVRRVGGKALPQYFLMVGGGVAPTGAHFARLAAKIPARRLPVALERLIALYQAERAPGETATAFFRRVTLERVQLVVADLEKITPAEATAEDFIDLGEDHQFVVETTEGECAA